MHQSATFSTLWRAFTILAECPVALSLNHALLHAPRNLVETALVTAEVFRSCLLNLGFGLLFFWLCADLNFGVTKSLKEEAND